MKKLHGIKVVANAQKRHRRNKERHAWLNSPIHKEIGFLLQTDYPEHSLHRIF